MSRIYERFIHNSFSPYVETVLLNFISAYKKSYSSNHVLLRLIENWKKSRDNKSFMVTVLMDLPRAFDCIPYDLLAAKLHAYYSLSNDVETFVHSYLKSRKEGLKINDDESAFQTLLSGIPEGSILGIILFNILINDSIFFIKDV